MKFKNKKFIFLTILLFLGFIELGASVALKFFPKNDSIDTSYNKEKGCIDVISTTEIDLWYGLIYRDNFECIEMYTNKDGFISREFPTEKNITDYNILILGGSVAEMFYYDRKTDGRKGNEWFFETYLRDKYKKISGRKIKLYNAARPGFMQPLQLMALNQLASKMDLVISIEGYNEFHSIGQKQYPSKPFEYYILKKKDSFSTDLNFRTFLRSLSFIKELNISKIIYRTVLAINYNKILEEQIIEEERGEILNVDNTVKVYSNNLRSLGGICRAYKIKCYVFFQPIPQIGKKLTEKEYALSQKVYGEELTANQKIKYQDMVTQLIDEEHLGLKKISALNIFENVDYDIYIDEIHYHLNTPGDIEKKTGNDYLADFITKNLEQDRVINEQK